MENLYSNHAPWEFEVFNNEDLPYHTFLYKLPVSCNYPPEPIQNNSSGANEDDIVQLPYYAINKEVGNKYWNSIVESLSHPIQSSQELELAIKRYNKRVREFTAFHCFFQVVDEGERNNFFNNLLPKIIKLALRLPELVLTNIPILKQNSCRSVSVSQLQVSSLLANAFLCTYWGAGTCPGINFDKLFNSNARPKREKCVLEKIRTLCHYFERITYKEPVGVITFERQYFSDDLPSWHNSTHSIKDTKICVVSNGLIENNSDGFHQVDFANKNVGGGVLGYGCVQEEIRFIISPELIVSRLFTEQLGPTEALIITGVERFSDYSGYGDTYTWKGNYQDTTPFDKYGRRRTSIVAIDAIRFTKSTEQYKANNMLRELNKAYAGFYCKLKQPPPIATGNWGCGAYKGDPKLKSLLQIMACGLCNRDIVYFTFNDDQLCKNLQEMIDFLVRNDITIGQLWKYLCWFSETKLKADRLYTFLRYIHFNTEKHPEEEMHNFSDKQMQNTVPKVIRRNILMNDDIVDEDLSLLFNVQ